MLQPFEITAEAVVECRPIGKAPVRGIHPSRRDAAVLQLFGKLEEVPIIQRRFFLRVHLLAAVGAQRAAGREVRQRKHSPPGCRAKRGRPHFMNIERERLREVAVTPMVDALRSSPLFSRHTYRREQTGRNARVLLLFLLMLHLQNRKSTPPAPVTEMPRSGPIACLILPGTVLSIFVLPPVETTHSHES